MKHAQIVIGPAGSGKSTYCCRMQQTLQDGRRPCYMVNLDPAAEYFEYTPDLDIRELITIDDVMEEDSIEMGPNGSLIFCLEYLLDHIEWLDEKLVDVDDDYLIIDCPGQIELYTHLDIMVRLVKHLQARNYYVCAVYIQDSQLVNECHKFIGGILSTLSTMILLEVAHINVLTKIDLLTDEQKLQLENCISPQAAFICEQLNQNMPPKFRRLNQKIANIVDDYSLVNYMTLDYNDEESIRDLLIAIDNCIQYGEDVEPKNYNDFLDDIQE